MGSTSSLEPDCLLWRIDVPHMSTLPGHITSGLKLRPDIDILSTLFGWEYFHAFTYEPSLLDYKCAN